MSVMVMLMIRRRRRVAKVCLLAESRAALEGSGFAGVRRKVGLLPCKGMKTGCPHIVMDLAHIGIYKYPEKKKRGVRSACFARHGWYAEACFAALTQLPASQSAPWHEKISWILLWEIFRLEMRDDARQSLSCRIPGLRFLFATLLGSGCSKRSQLSRVGAVSSHIFFEQNQPGKP